MNFVEAKTFPENNQGWFPKAAITPYEACAAEQAKGSYQVEFSEASPKEGVDSATVI